MHSENDRLGNFVKFHVHFDEYNRMYIFVIVNKVEKFIFRKINK